MSVCVFVVGGGGGNVYVGACRSHLHRHHLAVWALDDADGGDTPTAAGVGLLL